MTRQTTTQEKPFLENGLINEKYLYDNRIANADIEGINTWHLMELVAKVRLIDIGTQQARSIENRINDLSADYGMFNCTINLDEITVKDLIEAINNSNVTLQNTDYENLMKILEQLEQLDKLGFMQIVTEKCLKRSII